METLRWKRDRGDLSKDVPVMTTFDDVRAAVRAARARSPAFSECAEALDDAPALEELGPGRTTASEALATFSTRRETARRGGIDSSGVEETVDALRSMPRDEELLLFHFSAPDRLFTIFVSASDGRPVGCIRVMRRTLAQR